MNLLLNIILYILWVGLISYNTHRYNQIIKQKIKSNNDYNKKFKDALEGLNNIRDNQQRRLNEINNLVELADEMIKKYISEIERVSRAFIEIEKEIESSRNE